MPQDNSAVSPTVTTTQAYHRVELVVFDVTGTTVSDDGVVVQAYQTALAGHDIAFDAADLVSARGAAKHEVFHRLVARARPGASASEVEELTRAAHAQFQRSLSEAYATGPLTAVPGAEDTFRRLRQGRIRVALTTGFDRSLLRIILRRLGWEEDLLDTVVAADEVERGRPAPDMIQLAMRRTNVHNAARVAVVGDTVVDLEAGANAGAGLIVGVLTGAHERARLSTARHTHILDSVADLPSLLTNVNT